MTTPNPRPNAPGTARPGMLLPGQHLPGATGAEPADPERVRAEVRELLAELGPWPDADARGPRDDGAPDAAGTDLHRRAQILDQAHEVLVRALATVDKI